jgi:hypothetical protein
MIQTSYNKRGKSGMTVLTVILLMVFIYITRSFYLMPTPPSILTATIAQHPDARNTIHRKNKLVCFELMKKQSINTA